MRPAVTITKAHPARVKALEVPVVDHDAGAVMGGPAGAPRISSARRARGAVRLWDLRTVGQGARRRRGDWASTPPGTSPSRKRWAGEVHVHGDDA